MDIQFILNNINNANIITNYLYNNITSIDNLIITNNNPQTKQKISIITALHYCISNNDSYTIALLIKKLITIIINKIADMKLASNANFAYPINSIYYVNKVNNSFRTKLLILHLLLFHYEAMYQRTNKYTYFVGIDYEFNDKKIALCQICLFPNSSNKYIWIFDPKELDTEQTSLLIKYLFTSKYIYKIFHGSDSLDIPYMFQELFSNDKNIILKFIERVIDTRFNCEFQKYLCGYPDKKCSIYDALLYFGTIDQNKYNSLVHDNTSMDSIQNINWNVHDMSNYHLNYALYDVFYLRELLFDILRKAKKDNPSEYINIELIPEITRFIYLEKWNISNLLAELKIKTDTMNNYMVKYKTHLTLIGLYNNITKNMYLDNINLNLDHLLNINYFKSSLVILFKYIVYSITSNKYQVSVTKDVLFNDDIDHNIILDHLKDIKMLKLIKLLNSFISKAKKNIESYFNN